MNVSTILSFSSDENLELLQHLEAVADKNFDGHLTIMRFTTNWRIGFWQPGDRDDIQLMSEGCTFREAAVKALAGADMKGR